MTNFAWAIGSLIFGILMFFFGFGLCAAFTISHDQSEAERKAREKEAHHAKE